MNPNPILQTISEEEAKRDTDSIEREKSGRSSSSLIHNPQSNLTTISEPKDTNIYKPNISMKKKKTDVKMSTDSK